MAREKEGFEQSEHVTFRLEVLVEGRNVRGPLWGYIVLSESLVPAVYGRNIPTVKDRYRHPDSPLLDNPKSKAQLRKRLGRANR